MPKKTHIKDNEFTILLGMATIVGIVSGYGAVAFKFLLATIQDLAFVKTAAGQTILDRVINTPWYFKLTVTSITGMVVASMIYYLAREAKGHGVPEVMESIALKGGVIRPRVVFVKALASALTIGTGGSAGSEGPMVQIASATGSTVGQFFKLSKDNIKTLVGCGTAAGIAATFNAPIAGTLFAAEVVLRNFSSRILSPIAVSSVLATVVSYHYMENKAIFNMPAYSMNHDIEIVFYIFLGFFTGWVSVQFTKGLYYLEHFFDNLPVWPPFIGLFGGFIIGILGIYIPNVMGNGYDTINLVVKNGVAWKLLIFFCVAKLAATCITLSTGGSGGIFAPALFMGATSGGLFGIFIKYLFPAYVSSPSAYALVGMGAVVAGTTHGPITSIIILFELTRDYNIVLPLMITTIIATTFSSRIMKESIYTQKLKNRGINIHLRESEKKLQSLTVEDVMHYSFFTVPANLPANKFINLMLERNDECYYILEDGDIFAGVITIHDLPKLLQFEGDYNLLVVKDLVNDNYITTTPDEFLINLLHKFEFDYIEEIPVVDRKNPKKLVGIVSRRDIIETYEHEILRKSMRDLKYVDDSEDGTVPENVELPDTHKLKEISLPKVLAGATLAEVNMGARFGITVVGIKRMDASKNSEEFIIPTGNTKFIESDRLLIIMKEDSMKKFNEYIKNCEKMEEKNIEA